MTVLIGIDVGGTNLRLGVVDYDETTPNIPPRLIEEKRFQTDFLICVKFTRQSKHGEPF